MKNRISDRLCRMGVALIGAAILSAGCADDESPGGGGLASKITMSLSRYYNAQGTTTLPFWESSSTAGLFVVGGGVSQPFYASPILAGSQESLFLFTLDGVSETVSTVVGFWPADAPLTCENGVLTAELPALQTGTITPCLIGQASLRLDRYEGCEMELSQYFCTLYVSIKKGNYSVRKIRVEANGGEAIAGRVSIDLTTGTVRAAERFIEVVLPEALDCTGSSQLVPVAVAPVALSEGFTVQVTDTEGRTFEVVQQGPVNWESGGKYETDEARSNDVTELIFCGDNMIYMIDADLADPSGYKEAVTWSWDATTASAIMGLAASRCNHLDECKPVDGGTKILATSSYGWCVLLEVKSRQVLFYTTSSSNAHSAEILPDERLVVACSDGSAATNNVLQLYDIDKPNRVLQSVPLVSAHGVVWNEATQRLYAIGGQSLQIYRLENWDTEQPALVLERTVSTPQNGLHDLTLVNANTLCVGGKRAYLYDISTERFTEMTLFATSTSIKSINYNDETGELWYTDATYPEGSQSWSTQTIRYATDMNGFTEARTIKVPDLDMYKVRVMSW